MDTSKRIVILLSCVCLVLAQDVRLPPSIKKQNTEVEVFLPIDSQYTLICEASGYPAPEYEWYLNGIPALFQPDEIEKHLGVGSVTIKSFTYSNAGTYQCKVFNKYGKTMTRKIKVGAAFIAGFPPDNPQTITKKAGDSLKLKCDVPKSAPKPTISWRPVASLDNNPESTTIIMSRRVQIDDSGNLVFAYVVPEDHIGNWYYRCFVENNIAGLSAFGSYSQLTVLPNLNPTNVKPVISAYTGDNIQGGIVVALKRKTFKLRCLFSGKPEPSVSWRRKDGKPLPQDRINYEEFQTVLIINKVEDYDEAVYECLGTNSMGSATHDITMNVEASPVFTPGPTPNTQLKPVNKNATDGEDVTFECSPEAEPAAEIIWYINSEVLRDDNMPARVKIDPDRKKLHVSKVCKDCKTGDTDLKVYACEAVNKHGSNFSSGYLNVLTPTVMDVFPGNHGLKFDEKEIKFTCAGTTDPSTALKYSWFRDEEEVDIIENEIIVTNDEKSTTLTIYPEKLEHKGKEYLGNYTCVLTNTYSSVNATASLYEIPGAVPTEAVKTGSVKDLWWVFLIVGILLLLLILILCCCICIQRNKGDSYPVDEKERANGNDPEKELAINGFHDYQRPEDGPVKGSRASLNSAMKLDSDDDESLAEYDDPDMGKFNEDGSFIGIYNTGDRRRGDTNV